MAPSRPPPEDPESSGGRSGLSRKAPRWSAIPCAALIGVAAKASTIRHGSVRTHLKLMLPGYAAGVGWQTLVFVVVTRSGGDSMLLGS
ncbi:predicted protein [Chaetomium globosum CBS 148.51]|uniref:Uncharacterized protein n=1 Tax=Chaetomium globosum (strain ATCC 6205 / CBS 148.51 / DSM 1962 / NBRC 6347 / NRRL 1970) TaxID=306901 RepID=Q2H941_CHAGB|nr:uncharacterized protein CHGG_03263 [Chaetomium globosum CBS 148.51]EAQ91328.1 predicted protein [Chaetomium globosum CBS 148.51]